MHPQESTSSPTGFTSHGARSKSITSPQPGVPLPGPFRAHVSWRALGNSRIRYQCNQPGHQPHGMSVFRTKGPYDIATRPLSLAAADILS